MGSTPIRATILKEEKMNIKMKCCFCGKEIDITKNEIPAQWFGRYKGDHLLEVICLDCIETKEDKWRNKK